MKKLLFLFSAVLIASFAFGQNANGVMQKQTKKDKTTKTELRKDDFTNGLNHSKSIQLNSPVAKNMMVALSEDFEGGLALPAGWGTSDTNPWIFSDAVDLANLTNHTTGADGNVAEFDCYSIQSGEGTLTTPNLDVTAGDATFSFWINYYLIEGTWGNAAELYVGVSNDDGLTWTESSTNLIAGQHGAGWFQHTMDLTAFESVDFTGDVVSVRLRAVSDYGSYNIAVDDFAGPEIYVPAVPDLQVTGALDIAYTMLPLEHVSEITPSASVINIGSELTDATDVDFAVTGESYTGSVALTVPMANGVSETVNAISGFTPTTLGVFEFTMDATLATDNNPADNSDAVNFTVTEDELAYDNENIDGQLGAGTGAMLGNKFVFNADDGLSGAKFYITDNITDGYDCTVKVIDYTGGVVGDVLATSNVVSVAGATNAWYTANFDNLPVTAGQEVLIVVDNLDAAVFMALGLDARYVPGISYASTDGAAFSEVGSIGFPNLFLVRAITGEPAACPMPTSLSANATTNEADLTWTSSSDTWNIEWGLAGFTQGEGTLIEGTMDNPYSVTGLEAGTSYDFYVQADCGGDGTSEWAGPVTFTTDVICETIESYPYLESFEDAVPPACWTSVDNDGDGYNWGQILLANTGDYGAVSASYDNDLGALTPDNYLISPQFNINDADLELRFYVTAVDPDWSEESYEVLVSTTGTAPADFTAIHTETLPAGLDVWNEVTLPLADYNGEMIYIAIRHYGSTDQFQIAFDDFEVHIPLSDNQIEATEMNVYPNPANNVVYVENAENANITVLNMLGQVVSTQVANSNRETISTANLSEGTYILRIENGNEVSTKKVNVVR
jgi:hypothetical protein